MTDQSVDSVQERLKLLVKRGLINRKMQKRPDGGRTTDRYTLLMGRPREHAPECDTPTGNRDAPHRNSAAYPTAECGAPHSNGAAAPTATVREQEPSVEPSLEHPPKPPNGGPRDDSSGLGAKSEKAAARSGDRRRSNKAKIVLGDDEREHFNRGTPHVARVANIIITGTHADLALENARKIYSTTEPEDVEPALVKASGEFNKPRSAETQPDLDAVLRWTADSAARLAAISMDGTPEKQAGGPAGVQFRQTFSAPWCLLAQPFLNELIEKYPAAIDDVQQYPYFGLEFRRIVQGADKSEYGGRLQGAVEEQFERCVAEVHTRNEPLRATRAEAEARQRQWMEESRRKTTEAAQGASTR